MSNENNQQGNGTMSLSDVLAQQGITPGEVGDQSGIRPGGTEGLDLTDDTIKQLQDAGFQITAPTAAQDEQGEGGGVETPVETPGDDTPTDLTIEEPEDAATGAADVEAFAQYTQEFVENGGTLSDASRAEIMKAHNIDDAVLDLVLKGINAQRQENANTSLTDAGFTQAQFKEAAAWSKQNESKEKVQERNRLLQSTDPAVRSMALKDLMASAGGSAEPVHDRNAPANGGGATGKDFQTILDEAMQNPLYHEQNARGDKFRAAVYAALEKARR